MSRPKTIGKKKQAKRTEGSLNRRNTVQRYHRQDDYADRYEQTVLPQMRCATLRCSTLSPSQHVHSIEMSPFAGLADIEMAKGRWAPLIAIWHLHSL